MNRTSTQYRPPAKPNGVYVHRITLMLIGLLAVVGIGIGGRIVADMARVSLGATIFTLVAFPAAVLLIVLDIVSQANRRERRRLAMFRTMTFKRDAAEVR